MPAAKPSEVPIDQAERTLEMDMRWLVNDKKTPAKSVSGDSPSDEPTVVLDLTATQIHDLLIDPENK